MIKKIGSFEAKTHFAELILEASKGREYLITKNGKPMARIMPPEEKPEFDALIDDITALRKNIKTTTQKEIKALVNDGRKY